MTPPAPGRVLRRAVIGWGLGDFAMGRTGVGAAWLLAEGVLLAIVVAATILLVDTTWYLLPFLLGIGFLLLWAGQAVLAYGRARGRQAALAPAAPGSPALAVAWLAVPLLLWGTGFWLVAGGAATPSAVIDRFVTDWPETTGLAAAPAVSRAAGDALDRLRQLCGDGRLAEDCQAAPANLLRDVRFRIDVGSEEGAATAVGELVEYRRQPSTFLGIFQASELVPVPVERILTLQLRAEEAPFGSRRWTIVNAEAG